jgi:hypothetical protein
MLPLVLKGILKASLVNLTSSKVVIGYSKAGSSFYLVEPVVAVSPVVELSRGGNRRIHVSATPVPSRQSGEATRRASLLHVSATLVPSRQSGGATRRASLLQVSATPVPSLQTGLVTGINDQRRSCYLPPPYR